MAERRMLARAVTDSDTFIAMPSAAQALYLHLNQGADDDGFTNQISLAMWKSHASVDDLKILIAKGFVLQLDEGLIVITHWKISNQIRKDRYKKTTFTEAAEQIEVKPSKEYKLADSATSSDKLLVNFDLSDKSLVQEAYE